MKMEVILYTYNHKIKHNATGRTPADIFIYAGTPAYNSQIIKEAKIEQLNKKRQHFEVNTKFRKAPIIHGKLHNPYKKTGNIEQIDNDHFEETNRGRKIKHYKRNFQRQKKVNKSKYLQEDPDQDPAL